MVERESSEGGEPGKGEAVGGTTEFGQNNDGDFHPPFVIYSHHLSTTISGSIILGQLFYHQRKKLGVSPAASLAVFHL